MKKPIFTLALVALVNFANFAQSLQLTYEYSICDVYYIQDSYPNNPSCITSNRLTGGSPGYTKTVEEYEEPSVVYIPGAIARKIKRQVEVPSTEYSYRVYKNTCSEDVKVYAIRKVRLNTGQIMYEDASFWVKSGETKQNNMKFLNDYNSENAEIGSTVAYKNALNIDSDTYNTYINSVVNIDRGTLVVTPTSTKTRIFLNSGDKVIIKAEGSIRLGMFAGYGGPNGIEGFSDYSRTPNIKHGSLIYYFGDSGWRFVGSNTTITAQEGGDMLWLAVNDKSTDDNEGQFIVNYEIIRANSTLASTFNSLPQSLSDLEKIANLNKNELDTYLVNNSFTSIREKDGQTFFMREKDDVQLVLGFKKDYLNHKTTLFLGTSSKERYLKIKNSLSVEGYVYSTTENQMAMYTKTVKTSHSPFNIDVGFSDTKNSLVLSTINN